jgi:hypothetical protein
MQMLDKNYNKLEIGDKVLLFGMIGTVYQDTNALGLFFEEGIDWKLVKSNMTKIQGCEKEIYFCYNKYFISFWELMNNLTTGEEDVCHIAEKQLPY